MSQTIDATLAAHLAEKQNSGDNQPAPKNNSQNSQKKLDNNPGNSYINNDEPEPSDDDTTGSDPELEKYQRVLRDTFKNDPTKAVKSYVEAQAALTQKMQEYKKIEQPYQQLNTLLQNNPALFEIVKRASQGENVENLLRAKEPNGQPSVTKTASELEDSIDEQALAKHGLIDLSRKDSMSDYEWASAVLKAQQKYMITEYPKIAAKKYHEEIRKTQEEEQKRLEKERTMAENNKRYVDGIKEAAIAGWDFTKDHADVLEELEEEIVGLRDPKNLHLIRQDAVEIALDRIARRKGIEPPKAQTQQAPMNLRNNNQTNLNSRTNKKLETGIKDPMEYLITKGMENQRNRNGDYLQRFKTAKG